MDNEVFKRLRKARFIDRPGKDEGKGTRLHISRRNSENDGRRLASPI
jgi:hypothetical protein